jgi:hypothetical protein
MLWTVYNACECESTNSRWILGRLRIEVVRLAAMAYTTSIAEGTSYWNSIIANRLQAEAIRLE